MDDSSLLNKHEIEYTEYLLTNFYSDSAFNLNKKRVLFLSSTYGSVKASKSFFFNSKCKPWTNDNRMAHVHIVLLSELERKEIGYDIILIAWSKIEPEGRARKKFINNALQFGANK